MLKSLARLLDADAPVFYRYVCMAASCGVASGLTIATLAPAITCLLSGDTKGAIRWLAVLLAGAVVCAIWRRGVDKAGIRVGVSLLQGARQRIGDHVARLPVDWFTADNTSRLSHLLSHGMMEVAQLPAHVFTPVICGVTMPLAIAVALLVIQWEAGLTALAALTLLAVAFFLSARLGRRSAEAFQRDAARTGQRITEFAQAQSVLRAFNGGGGMHLVDEALDRQRRSGRQLISMSAVSVVLNTWCVQATFAALLVCALLRLQPELAFGAPSQAVAGVIAAMCLASRLVDPLLDVANYGEALRGAGLQLQAMCDILSARPLPQPEHAQPPADASVELREVSFSYAPGSPEVLCGIDLSIASGSMIALVGASGSGKTTLARLIARVFDASSGSVLVGGIDVRQIADAQLQAHISQVFQDVYLFQGSIAENILIGKPDASAAELQEAARLAHVSEIVERLPQGWDTPVGEGGARLSGGERQRISLARALIKGAPIMLIDETTAGLDAENQAAIAEMLASLRGRCTLLVIAHQLSTIAAADQIVVLNHGKIAEQGSHEALLAAGGIYKQMIDQLRCNRGWKTGAGKQAHA